jgi:hypothetical protein
MNGRHPRGWLKELSLGAMLAAGAWLAGCGGLSPASGAAPSPDASMIATSVPTGDDVSDAGAANPSFTAAAPTDGGGVLEAHIQVNGGGAACGACAVVLAQVQGGQQPYIYTWSDPTWQGPGPFQLCPQMLTPVSLTVTDSSQSSGEVPTPDQTAKASTSVDCTPSDAAVAPGDLNGCTASAASGVPEAGTNDAGSTECSGNEVEAGVAWADGGAVASEANLLPYTLRKGHTYSVSYDQLLPIVLGQPVTVDIYGSTAPNVCQVDQKLFTLKLDGSIFNWHQGYCFTPDQDYDYVVTNVYIQGVYFYFNALSASTICDTCPSSM